MLSGRTTPGGRYAFAGLAIVFLAMSGLESLDAQSHRTEHTIRLDSGMTSPPATLADVAWLQGHWRGPGLGGIAEEFWMEPSGGAMPGVFRTVADGEVIFYEIFALTEHEGSLVLRLKHFNPDMTGWEDKEEMVTFRLAHVEPGLIQFNSLTYRLETDDRLWIHVAVRQGDGTLEELEFELSRVR